MDPITVRCLAPLVFVLAAGGPAFADDVPADPPPTEPPPPAEPPQPDLKAAVDALSLRLQKVEDELEQAKDDNKYLDEKVQSLLPLTAKLGGYVDAGFFVTDGNGAGTRSDLLGQYFPEYIGKVPESWIFMGDPLSTTVNSRGDVADTGESRAIVFDPINSRGKSTFLINAVNLALFTGLGETSSAQVSIDFLPRARDISDVAGVFSGDYIDVKLAYGEWKPKIKGVELALQAGKFDSVLGYEYRSLESPDRTGVTPSLICRYTCGRPIGLKARARFVDNTVTANVAVTNGSHFSEGFPFANETDTNQFKTIAGRLSYLAFGKVEIGASGAFGAQDYQPENNVYQWHYGADLHLDYKDFELTAEFVQGKAKGKTSPTAVADCDEAPCIKYKGAYGLVGYRLTNMFTPYGRVDWRDAEHESGASFVYIAKLVRFTVGIRAEIGTRVILKAEGTLNRELGPIPQFPNDVLTTSLVLKL
jgi:Putative beta-barrel porin-2, OmpL-like. bbp2